MRIMRENTIKALWKANKPVSVGWMGTADPYITELMAHAGFDGLVLDMQHGMAIGPDRAAQWLQTVSTTKTVPLVRVQWNDPVHIQYVLDAGAMGVIIPLVRNKDEAIKAAGAARYAPLGYRSVGPNRARLALGQDYLERANEDIICLIMVETEETIPHLPEMVKVPGIDGFYVGPSDLAVSMGLPPGPAANAHPKHVAAVQATLDAAQAAGLVAGIHVPGPEEAVRRFQQGFRLSPIGTDTAFITMGARAAIDRTQALLNGASSPEKSDVTPPSH